MQTAITGRMGVVETRDTTSAGGTSRSVKSATRCRYLPAIAVMECGRVLARWCNVRQTAAQERITVCACSETIALCQTSLQLCYCVQGTLVPLLKQFISSTMSAEMLANPPVTQGPVQQHETAEKGRHLRASDHIPAGKRILQQEAVAAVLYDEHVAYRCHVTFKIVEAPLRCGGCKHARYASRHNQRRAWSLGHRQECAALQACHPNMPPPTVRLVALLYWRLHRCHSLSS